METLCQKLGLLSTRDGVGNYLLSNLQSLLFPRQAQEPNPHPHFVTLEQREGLVDISGASQHLSFAKLTSPLRMKGVQVDVPMEREMPETHVLLPLRVVVSV